MLARSIVCRLLHDNTLGECHANSYDQEYVVAAPTSPQCESGRNSNGGEDYRYHEQGVGRSNDCSSMVIGRVCRERRNAPGSCESRHNDSLVVERCGVFVYGRWCLYRTLAARRISEGRLRQLKHRIKGDLREDEASGTISP